MWGDVIERNTTTEPPVIHGDMSGDPRWVPETTDSTNTTVAMKGCWLHAPTMPMTGCKSLMKGGRWHNPKSPMKGCKMSMIGCRQHTHTDERVQDTDTGVQAAHAYLSHKGVLSVHPYMAHEGAQTAHPYMAHAGVLVAHPYMAHEGAQV